MEKIFYKNLKEFLKDLIVVFPEDDEPIHMITTAINLAIVDDDDNKIIKEFYKSLSPLEHHINTQDTSIFQMDPGNYWSQSSYEYKLFLKINSNWHTFSDHNKNILWEYIQLLYMLSKNITNKSN
jgi:hypothetical protein